MRTRTKGIQVADKLYKGHPIFARLGAVSQEQAESWL